jgi:hypothetical protein
MRLISSEGYILLDGDDLAQVEAQRLADVLKRLGSTLTRHFEEEVVPPVSPLDVGSYSMATPLVTPRAPRLWQAMLM